MCSDIRPIMTPFGFVAHPASSDMKDPALTHVFKVANCNERSYI
jgi:hypothetical protein